MNENCRQKDLIRSQVFVGMLALTAALVAGQIFWHAAHDWFSVALLLSWAVFCATNARRCGRRHCYFTAPILALGALAILLLHFGLADFPGEWINVFVVAGVALACLAEAVLGEHAGQPPQQPPIGPSYAP
ncbi:MAG: hypothetical protein ACRD6I_03215 [Candidatus Acidiferrales bacterium]